MCNLMARCITYFTMLVELLIIKNIKAVGVMLSAGYSSLYIPFNMCLKAFAFLGKNKAYICAAAETETLTLALFMFIKTQSTC